jgi:hypothetical protein
LRSRSRTSRTQARVVDETLHRVQPLLDGGDVKQRLVEPASQQPRPHRRERGVEHAQQTAGDLAAAHRLGQFQVAPRRFVERHELAQRIGGQPRHLIAYAGLHRRDVGQHTRRRAQCVGAPVQPKAVERGDAEVSLERCLRRLRLDLPGFDVVISGWINSTSP